MVINQGKLIVIDGIDGSGKTTQVNLLAEYLKEKKIPYEVISFPRYEDNLYGKLIRRYLEGEFGDINDVNPYLVALAYAGDRVLAKPLIEKWLAEGKLVIANRYVSASKAHLGANLPEEKRAEFINWLDELEYGTHKMPKADLTILLKVDPKIGQKNVAGKHTDIHEQNLKHLEEAHKIYLELAKSEDNWYVVDCANDGGMKTREKIQSEIRQILQNRLNE
ncbi:dTMP kinase [Candidatus Daviesbacteria bacterium]|nr:dTMP kinase [Candidatus Daviesbacteria bacterium]